MGKLVLVRIDNRMIHGQVASGWIGKSNADNIIVVDTDTANNDFMKDVLSLAVPFGMGFEVYTQEEGIEHYQQDGFGPKSTMLVFKDIETAYNCFKAGMEYPRLQIGGTGVRPGAKVIEGPITITDKEIDMLNEISASGIEIYLQQTVQSKSSDWSEVKKKL